MSGTIARLRNRGNGVKSSSKAFSRIDDVYILTDLEQGTLTRSTVGRPGSLWNIDHIDDVMKSGGITEDNITISVTESGEIICTSKR